MDALQRAARVRLMAFDVDGVLTDGRLYFSAAGDTFKAFNSLDGHGMKLLAESGVALAIITGRQSEIVAARARELGIRHVYQGIGNKIEAFSQLLAATGLDAADVGYMGDDWPDLGVIVRAGFAAAPANSHPEVLARAHWVAQGRGGLGAAREACEFVLRAQGRYDALLQAACGL
jgi:3-deoxy-D-manno-octulosonate 8-phosphate phosphatase (KDO 8-P phosphatase)